MAFITVTATPGAAVSGNLTWEMHDDQDENAFQALRNLFSIQPCPRKNATQNLMTLNSMKQVNAEKYNISFGSGDDNPSDFNIAAYQAFDVYVQTLLEIYKSGSGKEAFGGASVANHMLRKRYNTTGFGALYIDNGGQRRSRHCILDLNVTSKLFETVIYYEPYLKKMDNDDGMVLDFGGGPPPRNEPICGYLGTKCKPADNILTRTLPSVIAALAVLAVFFWLLFKRLSREQQIKSNIWSLDATLLEPATGVSVSSASFKSSKKLNNSMHHHYEKPDYRYKGEPVGVHIYLRKHGRKVLDKRNDKKLLMQIMQASHPNIVPFLGVCLQNERVYFLEKFCSRGSLVNVLLDTNQYSDWELRCSLINDLIEGLCYIHDSPLKRHGSLLPSVCLIDTRFTLLISQLGFVDLVGPAHNLIAIDKHGNLMDESDRWAVSSMNLRASEERALMDASGDIVRLGRIIEETLLAADTSAPPTETQTSLQKLVTSCSSNVNPKLHPTTKVIRDRFRRICKIKGDGLLVNILARMETYAAQLEKQVQERSAALAKERAICDELLLEVLPRWILDQLYSGSKITPEVFSSSTIFFSHIWGFLHFVSTHSPLQTFSVISSLFVKFDKIVPNFNVYKVETVEDQYMVFSGQSDTGKYEHAVEICRMALSFRISFSQTRSDGLLQFMAGAHTGPCAAGVIGHKCPRYCLFGDSVNVASRISTSSKPSRIHLSASTAESIQKCPEFVVKQRGLTSLKGRGEMQTFWLNSSSQN
ncbi:atrial natriuretic peptide receptor 1-like [Paramacrobiotus metropolitanus]|uniref:atrial natriuretic peptide receptor 1-like n=1 Tax=Paramacrobiotus metropolitanus TaxID=2943436 RepID=UPI002445D2EF|nr:atrial natriuretic peptide receptor 1-like [Paramacrobiotus metropolitanus]